MRRLLFVGVVAAKELVNRCKPGDSVQVRVGDGHWIDAVLVDDSSTYKVRFDDRPTYCSADPSKCEVRGEDIVRSCKCADHGKPCREFVEPAVTPAPPGSQKGEDDEDEAAELGSAAPGRNIQTRFDRRVVSGLGVALLLYVACALFCYSRNSRKDVKPRVEPMRKCKHTLDTLAAQAVAKEMPAAWVEEPEPAPPPAPKVENPAPLTAEERGRPLPPLPAFAGRSGPADWSGRPCKSNLPLRNGDAAMKPNPWRSLGIR